MRQKNTKRYDELSNLDEVFFHGVRGTVYKPGWSLEMIRPDIHVAVAFSDGKISHVHFESLEVEVPDPPVKPAPTYRETDYFVEVSTGALFKRQFKDSDWVFICITPVRPSIQGKGNSELSGFKRLYREV